MMVSQPTVAPPVDMTTRPALLTIEWAEVKVSLGMGGLCGGYKAKVMHG